MIYLTVFVISTLFFFWAEKTLYSKPRIVHIVFLLIALLLPSVLAGCRDLTVGFDTVYYMVPYFQIAQSCNTYASFLAKLPDIEPLYGLLTYIVASCTDNVAWLLFFQQIIIIFIVYLSAYQIRKNIPIYFCMIVYFLSFYYHSLNIVRQMLAMSFCLLSFSFLLKYQYSKSFISFLPAIGFHSTSFIFLIVYPLFYLAHKRKTQIIWQYIIFSMVIVFLCILNIEEILYFVVSKNILPNKFLFYSPGVTSVHQSQGFPESLFSYCVLLLILLRYCHTKKYRVDYFILVNCFSVAAMLFCISGVFINVMMLRWVYYFLFPFIIFLPMILYRNKRRIVSLPLLSFVILFLLSFWYTTLVLNDYSDVFPYTSKILGIR
jgi:hypothetical protein